MTVLLVTMVDMRVAATPPVQAGNYTGTLTGAQYTYDTGFKAPVKIRVYLVIYPNNTWSLTGTGLNLQGDTGVFGAVDCALTVTNVAYSASLPLHFHSNGKVQGTLHVINFQSYGYCTDGKLSLKPLVL